jgi:3D (Asp-Asp-Asp) domain-containing protein
VAKTTNVAEKAIKTVKAVMTAYSSTPDQTDDTPFITASGKTVADGIVANNMLPFGTKVRIPELYGDKVFVVQDRMNRRMGDHRFDIWMPDRTSALKFGVKTVVIEVLES